MEKTEKTTAEELIPKKDLIAIRDAVAGDQAFIFATFLKGLRFGNDYYKLIDQDSYFKNYHQILTQLLIRRQCKVACLKSDSDTILGYSIFSGTIVDWVFVKPAWRRIGIAKDLLPVGINTCTHLNKLCKSIKPPQWSFDPFKI